MVDLILDNLLIVVHGSVGSNLDLGLRAKSSDLGGNLQLALIVLLFFQGSHGQARTSLLDCMIQPSRMKFYSDL